jgi:hypothetical protein
MHPLKMRSRLKPAILVFPPLLISFLVFVSFIGASPASQRHWLARKFLPACGSRNNRPQPAAGTSAAISPDQAAAAAPLMRQCMCMRNPDSQLAVV